MEQLGIQIHTCQRPSGINHSCWACQRSIWPVANRQVLKQRKMRLNAGRPVVTLAQLPVQLAFRRWHLVVILLRLALHGRNRRPRESSCKVWYKRFRQFCCVNCMTFLSFIKNFRNKADLKEFISDIYINVFCGCKCGVKENDYWCHNWRQLKPYEN